MFALGLILSVPIALLAAWYGRRLADAEIAARKEARRERRRAEAE